uniref:SAP domain-containing protein n=1 Tax=viral metagenome TaxID=1070528 RepID=A0A6C0BYW1_9ZZZZ
MQITDQNKNLFLSLLEEDDVTDNDNECLITSTKLTDNFITLPCTHKFNYEPLFEAVKIQKLSKTSYRTLHLAINEIQCPYCRTIHNKLLPFVPTEANKRTIISINAPDKFCMHHMECSWKFKSGIRKNTLCNCKAYKSEVGVFCKSHHSRIIKQKEAAEVSIHWNGEMESLKKFTIPQLKVILHKGNLKKTGNKACLINRIVTNKKKYTT